MAGDLAVACQQLFKIISYMGAYNIPLVGRNKLGAIIFSERYIEMVEPEISEHFLQFGSQQ